MKSTCITPLHERNPEANSFEINGQGEGVLLLHGFTGTPAELRPVGNRISETLHWEVSAPLLPGHGTTLEDLSTQTMEDWLSAVMDARDKLLQKFPRVHLLGLCMGASLCLETFRREPEKVASLVLLAPALWLRSRRDHFLARLLPKLWLPKRFQVHPKKSPPISGWVGYDAYSVPAVGEFIRLTDRVRSMPKIDATPTLVIYSESDDTAHPRSARFVEKHLGHSHSKVVRLEEADHVLTLSQEKERVLSEIASFYRGLA